MTRKEAINELQGLMPKNGIVSSWTPQHAEALTMAIEALKSPWVSVKDGLPKCGHSTDNGNFSDTCICKTSEGRYVALAMNEVTGDDGIEYFWADEWGIYDEDVNGEVTHWMPIPETNQRIGRCDHPYRLVEE